MSDLCFVVDGTGSMAQFFNALQDSLPQFFQLLPLIGAWERLAVLVYRDYDVTPVVEFSGWGLDAAQLGEFVRRQKARGGGDHPEAAKSAAARVRPASVHGLLVLRRAAAPPARRVLPEALCRREGRRTVVQRRRDEGRPI